MHQSDQDIRNRLLIARLPAMPQILIKLIEHLQADDAGLPELAGLIAKDAAMSSKILAVANSSAYRRHGRAFGLEQSLATLGTDTIKTLVISESVFQTFNSFPHSASTDLRPFWKHSLTAAVLARAIAARMAYPHVEEAYLAGLLHNVGRLALLAAAPREYAVNFMACDDAALCSAEQRTLQITHAEAGAWLIERWQLDSFLADSVLYHHEPAARLASSHPLIRIVRLAHLLASLHDDEAALADLGRLCGLEHGDLDSIRRAAAGQVEKEAAQLGIDLAGADEIAAPPAWSPPPDPVQQRLSEQVRNLVLVSEMGQAFARQQDESGLLDMVARSARILFDFDNVAILLENPNGQALVGIPAGEQQRLAEFSIPLGAGGAVAACALERRLAFVQRDGDGLGIAEEQLLRILASDSLVCVPLLAGPRCLGVLIGGAPAWQMAGLERRARFLQSFANEAAGALETAIAARGLARRQVAQADEEFRAASRRVVHEVNNPLAIIKNYLSVLDGKLARREPVAGEMSVLHEEIDRVGQLINGLVEAAPAAAGDATDVARGVLDVAHVVEDVLRLLRATDFVPPSVQIVARMADGPSEIDGGADLLKQILLNLIKNAVEALPDGGRIEISQRGHVSRERRVYLELSVGDSGPGLPAEVLATLFSAVRSSKDGPHRGLGLSIVHALVQKLQGHISCRSGHAGTVFEILLPLRAGAPARLLNVVRGHG